MSGQDNIKNTGFTRSEWIEEGVSRWVNWFIVNGPKHNKRPRRPDEIERFRYALETSVPKHATQEMLDSMSPSQAHAKIDWETYDKPYVLAVDTIILTIQEGELAIVLIERGEGTWALPGGVQDLILMDDDEPGTTRAQLQLIEATAGLSSAELSKPVRHAQRENVEETDVYFPFGAPGTHNASTIYSTTRHDSGDKRFNAMTDVHIVLAPEHLYVRGDGVETTKAFVIKVRPFLRQCLERPQTMHANHPAIIATQLRTSVDKFLAEASQENGGRLPRELRQVDGALTNPELQHFLNQFPTVPTVEPADSLTLF